MKTDDISQVLNFWFEELEPRQWWVKEVELDALIRERFGSLHVAAGNAELFTWRASAEGRLAEIIVLDQFSRNIYRDKPEAFACDSMALVLAQEAVRHSLDQVLDVPQKAFFYMPYMHSESPLIHVEALRLFSQPGVEFNLEFEEKHKAIIDRFGRYPHRNKILGRTSTSEELAFLKGPDSSF
ncbi:MAG TPA: DUF924 family protein [Mariprofundaceae bacterium]|nr:DUF924 family protein [Mariprofundaceae bacterium]